MKSKLHYLGHEWPDTGRRPESGAKLEIHEVRDGLLDLVWFNEGAGLWTYLSTIKTP